MKKRMCKLILAGIFLMAVTLNFIIKQGPIDQDFTLLMKNIEALADGEGGSECTHECWEENCEMTQNPNDYCHYTCGSKHCKTSASVEKE